MTKPRTVERTEEATYDGRQRTGMIVHNSHGHEAHSDTAGYLGTFPTHAEAAKAIYAAEQNGPAQ